MRLVLLLFIFAGCAQITSLNLRKHHFGRLPTKIIWLQIAGLDHEQLAMLRFSFPTDAQKTSLESAICTGHAWSYNLYHLRPKTLESQLTQLTGKKDVSGACTDWKHKPIWNYLTANNYRAGIIEVDAKPEESLLSVRNCPNDGKDFLGSSIFWSMSTTPVSGSQSYVPSVPQEYVDGQVYWDKTCGNNGCGIELRQSSQLLYGQFSKNSSRHIYIIRDFSLKHALEKQNFLAAREALSEIDKTVEDFYNLASSKAEVLVLVTGASSVDIDFPHEGKDWQGFELKGANAMSRKGELTVPVFAQGARAENFCGFYDEAQIFERILSGPKQQGLEFKVINPFN